MNVLVVSPHPDDETLGAGGTLMKLKEQGHSLFWLIVTNMKSEYGWKEEQVSHRQKQIEAVREIFGFIKTYDLELPPAGLTGLNDGDIIGLIRNVFIEVRPEWLIIPGQYDAHTDHRVVYNCCMACAKTFRAPYIKRIMTMEILSETDYGYQVEKFVPNLYVDITEQFEKKIEVMKLYDTEIEEAPFPRSLENIKAIASLRGSQCVSKYAEAFHVIKQIE